MPRSHTYAQELKVLDIPKFPRGRFSESGPPSRIMKRDGVKGVPQSGTAPRRQFMPDMQLCLHRLSQSLKTTSPTELTLEISINARSAWSRTLYE